MKEARIEKNRDFGGPKAVTYSLHLDRYHGCSVDDVAISASNLVLQFGE